MKFRGQPGMLVRITKVPKPIVRKVPKMIRFDEDGICETDNEYLIRRLSLKFEQVEEVQDGLQETEEKEENNEEEVEDIIEDIEQEVRQRAKELGIKSWHVKSIERLLSELEVHDE